MFDIDIIENSGVEVVDSRLLHKALGVRSYHADWIRRRIENYGFEEGNDYFLSQYSKMSNGIKTGGKLKKDYLLTLDMAKELCMIENTDVGKKARRYFIQAEKDLQSHKIVRIASKHVRRELTDVVKDSGENERMHGHGYGNYTKLVYVLTGLNERKKSYGAKDGFRDTLTSEELKRVQQAENMIKAFLDMDMEYSEIKDTVSPFFEKRKIQNCEQK
ncbi:MAG: antA/AntB antirepressor family protein [Spirochaetales bacterium]|nr:antA/AntB antirepressor family protein [Spirochaetales bacterium]